MVKIVSHFCVAGIAIAVLSVGLRVDAQQVPTIRVPVRLVNLSTLVFSKENQFIPDLQRSDFRVIDNGRSQSVTLADNSMPVSVALVIQVNQDVREYVPFIAKVGSVIDALLAGDTGESAVLTYGPDITLVKSFESGDVQSTLKTISASGHQARMIDAGVRAISLLAKRPDSHSRVLLFIGQSMDSGSESNLASLREQAEKTNVTVFALTLPEFGKVFVSDTFSLQGYSIGGFKAGVDLGRLIAVLKRSGDAGRGVDPFSILTAATGGTQLHFREQNQLEDAIGAIGGELRSAYMLSYYPSSKEPGYHNVKIKVDVPGAKVFARPGYWLSAD